jgi:hypothetical protein
VPTSNHTGLPSEVHNFDVKNHVAFNPLVVKGHALARVQTFESNAHVIHFFGNGVCPKGVAIVLVNFKSMVNEVGTSIPNFIFFIR